jgi:hypothetical protein
MKTTATDVRPTNRFAILFVQMFLPLLSNFTSFIEKIITQDGYALVLQNVHSFENMGPNLCFPAPMTFHDTGK